LKNGWRSESGAVFFAPVEALGAPAEALGAPAEAAFSDAAADVWFLSLFLPITM
jgi:hypothetical protein